MKTLKIAINGLGRIGRLLLRELINYSNVKIVVINDLEDGSKLAHLLNHDNHYQLNHNDKFTFKNTALNYGQQTIPITNFHSPLDCQWRNFNVDIVIEATGQFSTVTQLKQHLTAGAKKVFLTTNFKDITNNFKTLIYNFNHTNYQATDQIIALGSCTTNCLVLTIAALQKVLTFQHVLAETIHATTNQQNLLDQSHEKHHLARGVFNNIIPTTTKAAAGIKIFFPNLDIAVSALRVPVSVGSLLNINLILEKPLNIITFHNRLKQHTNQSFKVTDEYLVSSDIIGKKPIAIFNTQLTKMTNKWLKVGVWYDNEYGYVCQISQFLQYLTKKQNIES